ncbi:transcriptional regulator [Pseudonocardia sp. CNS-139]|nr:transcriptional regulator [Pseudonocardia sp. CNS-139]
MSDESPWLSPRTVAEVELNTGLLPEVLRDYRRTRGINQADLAQILNFDQSYISKVENGQRQIRDVEMLLRIAQQLDIAPNRLGISNELLRPVAPPSTADLVGIVDPVEASQAEWRAGRRRLNRNRGPLARAAAQLYRPDVRLGDVPLMARHEWIPSEPLRLEDIELEWTDDAAGVLVTGGEPEADHVLPLRAPGQRYTRYTAAIRYLDAPSLFENRPSYRLLDLDLSGEKGRMQFGLGTYFDKLDVSEAVGHELALVEGADTGSVVPTWSALPLRGLIGDPFDLRRRYVMPAIETLTLRRDRRTGEATFLLHWRDPAKVATAAGIYGLIPAGEFQPSSIASWDRENDFDLWRSILREYSEEILGEPERDGSSGEPIDYENWPLYRQVREARANGQTSVFCLGVGLDTLTLTATILTVAVFDDDSRRAVRECRANQRRRRSHLRCRSLDGF